MSKGGLTQDDFRKILATPRAPTNDDGFKAPAPKLVPARKDSGDASGSGGGSGSNKPFKPRKFFNKQKDRKKNGDEDDEDNNGASGSYRDRAKERRLGINDYSESEQILAMLSQNEEAPLLAAASSTRSPGRNDDDPLADLLDDEEEPSNPTSATTSHPGKISIETSQLLGGDEKYTHLVRGLDRTLLAKVRTDLQSQSLQDDSAALAEAEAYIRRIDGDAEPEFMSGMAKEIYRIAVLGRSAKLPLTNPLFAPGRMAFVYDLGFDNGTYVPTDDLPTNLIRSRMEVSGEEQSRKESDMVVLKVADAIALAKSGKGRGGEDDEDGKYVIGEDGKRRVKRKDKEGRKRGEEEDVVSAAAPSATASAPKKPEPAKEVVVGIDEDEDIFGDAGRDYTLQVDPSRHHQADSNLAPIEEPSVVEPYPDQPPQEEPDEDIFGPSIPAEFRRPRDDEEEEDTFGPQIPAEFRRSRDEQEDEEMANPEDQDSFGPQIPAEFRTRRADSDDNQIDEEEEYRLQISKASAPQPEQPKQVKTDYFGKLVIDGREVSSSAPTELATEQVKITDLVRQAGAEVDASLERLEKPEVTRKKKRIFMEDQGDYYTGLGGSFGYDSDEDTGEAKPKLFGAEGGKKGEKGGRGEGSGGGGKQDASRKKQKLNNELQQIDKVVKEKWGSSITGNKKK